MQTPARATGILLCLCLFLASTLRAADPKPTPFDKQNLVPWCIVPFDAKNRSPEDRAAMLARLGLKKFAYDWRPHHLPTFERELAALKKHHIELTALWLPAPVSKEGQFLLGTVKKHNLHPQLWVMLSVEPQPTQQQTIRLAANTLKPLANQAADMNCKVALYNHGGWFGDPENQIAIIQHLQRHENLTNIGIVYNLHHAHDHLDRFPELLTKMKPHLLCLNLNGTTKNGDKTGKKILPIGQGDLDPQILQTIRDSQYTGPLGILNHVHEEDAESRLKQNIKGLEQLVSKLPAQ
jgi:sugar phosphate isomerase/epimerase